MPKSKLKERASVKKSQAMTELLRSRSFVLVTPKKAILLGQLSDNWEGFLQIHSIVMMRDLLGKIIKDWEARHGGNDKRRKTSRRNKQTKVR